VRWDAQGSVHPMIKSKRRWTQGPSDAS